MVDTGLTRSFDPMTRAQAFEYFLAHFSKEALPVVLSDDNVAYFSNQNRPLSPQSIQQFIKQKDVSEDDELTEYVPCCIIPDTQEMHAIVYWKGELLNYEFIMATYDKNGTLLHRKTLAGTRVEGNLIMQSIATIEEDWTIHVVVGAQSVDDRLYDSEHSQNMSLELMPSGEIIFSLRTDEL